MAESVSGDSSNPTPPPATAPDRKSWADEVEEEVPDQTNAASSSSTTVSSLNVDELTIDENKKATKSLNEPDDSNIQAVRSLILLFCFSFLNAVIF